MDCKLQIEHNGQIKTVMCETGENLFTVLLDNHYFIDAPCGGKGTCGKCKVIVNQCKAPLTDKERTSLTKEEINAGTRLSCRCTVEGDMTVRLLSQTNIDVAIEGDMGSIKLNPLVSQVTVTMEPSTLQEQISDKEKLLLATGAREISHDALTKLPSLLRNCDYKISAVLRGDKIIHIESPDQAQCYGMAVDIGTTTVVAYFYDLLTGVQVGVESGLNRQRKYGADVITRIEAATENADGLSQLWSEIIGQLNEMIQGFCKKVNAQHQSIFDVTIAGNTTMLHLLCGYDPRNIANAPFIPVTLFGDCLPAQLLSLQTAKDAAVYLAPCISAYVGGDISVGMAAYCLDHMASNSLFLDIGTNGEMTFWGEGGIICCSTAAGPAFEGAHIKHGTGGVPGAINSVTVQDGNVTVTTISNAPPVGICGSGLISAVAALIDCGAIDETGRLCDRDEVSGDIARYIDEDAGEFILCPDQGIVLTQQDIREVQLAKAAFAAGINTLLHHAGVTLSEVGQVYLAGGFGSHIDKKAACRIGLIPAVLEDKLSVVGNAAGMGAVRILLNAQERVRCQALTNECRYIELSSNSFFGNEYIEQMCF